MTELFPNVSQKTRCNVDFMWQVAMAQPTALGKVQSLLQFVNNSPNEEERDYLNMAFMMKFMEAQKNESSSN